MWQVAHGIIRKMRRLVLLAVSLLVSDTILYVALKALDSSRIFYDRSAVDSHRLDFWLSHSYDPELGWDIPAGGKNNLGASRRSHYPALPHYEIKAFGDSFTFGSDVEENQTWEAVIERETRWSCLNYGVPGYSPDQALLKYQRTRVKTQFTILGIPDENIARVVNIYRAFYMDDWGPPKPRFFVDGESLRLEPNPIARPEDARLLLDPAFVDSLRRLDYWPRYNEEILGEPRRLQWPALWTVLRHAPFFLEGGGLLIRMEIRPTYQDELRRYKPYHLYSESSEALVILARVIDRFVALCQERGERPLVLIFPRQHTVEILNRYGRLVYEPLVRRLRERGVPHIDFGPLLAREDLAPYYIRYNGHLSAAGNVRVAREVIHYVQRR